MPPADDQPGRRNPGIGTSKGAFATGAPPSDVAGQDFNTGIGNDEMPRGGTEQPAAQPRPGQSGGKGGVWKRSSGPAAGRHGSGLLRRRAAAMTA